MVQCHFTTITANNYHTFPSGEITVSYWPAVVTAKMAHDESSRKILINL